MASTESGAAQGAMQGGAAGSSFGPWGAAIGAVGGGILGAINASGDRNASMDAIKDYYNRLNQIDLPDIEKMKLALAQYQSQGVLTPELEQAITQGPTALENVQIDPRLKQTQMQNLDTLNQIAQAGGFDPSQKADLAHAIQQMQQSSAAQQKAAQQAAEMRGMSSSGANLALQALAAQGAANNTADIGSKLAASAYQNKLNALQGSSGLAGQLRSQDYGEQANLANAKDAIARFNAQMSQQAQAANIAAKNQALAMNLANAQQLANSNVNLSNQQQQYNKGLYQQDFENKLRKAGAMQAPSNNLAGAYAARGDATANMWAGIGGGVAKGFAANQQQQNFDRMYPQQKQGSYAAPDLNIDQSKSFNAAGTPYQGGNS